MPIDVISFDGADDGADPPEAMRRGQEYPGFDCVPQILGGLAILRCNRRLGDNHQGAAALTVPG
jgi:hypothetical protein